MKKKTQKNLMYGILSVLILFIIWQISSQGAILGLFNQLVNPGGRGYYDALDFIYMDMHGRNVFTEGEKINISFIAKTTGHLLYDVDDDVDGALVVGLYVDDTFIQAFESHYDTQTKYTGNLYLYPEPSCTGGGSNRVCTPNTYQIGPLTPGTHNISFTFVGGWGAGVESNLWYTRTCPNTANPSWAICPTPDCFAAVDNTLTQQEVNIYNKIPCELIEIHFSSSGYLSQYKFHGGDISIPTEEVFNAIKGQGQPTWSASAQVYIQSAIPNITATPNPTPVPNPEPNNTWLGGVIVIGSLAGIGFLVYKMKKGKRR